MRTWWWSNRVPAGVLLTLKWKWLHSLHEVSNSVVLVQNRVCWKRKNGSVRVRVVEDDKLVQSYRNRFTHEVNTFLFWSPPTHKISETSSAAKCCCCCCCCCFYEIAGLKTETVRSELKKLENSAELKGSIDAGGRVQEQWDGAECIFSSGCCPGKMRCAQQLTQTRILYMIFTCYVVNFQNWQHCSIVALRKCWPASLQ